MAAADTLKKIEAAVEVLDLTKRTVAAIDKDGISHLMKWKETGYIGEKMAKLKVSYYREFTCEIQAEDLIITAVKFLDEPQWVKDRFKNRGGSGGRPQAPRNEKPMIFESVFKSCCDQASLNPFDWDSQKYEEKMDRIWAVAKKISCEIVQLSGA
jgi:hypothetical protein